jgi:hypothetical protein
MHTDLPPLLLYCSPLFFASYPRYASGSRSLSRLLPILPSRELGTRDAFQLRTHAHDNDDDWKITLSHPAAASPMPARSATPVHHAWGVEDVSGRLCADIAITFADVLSLSALDLVFAARLPHDQIPVRILRSGGV